MPHILALDPSLAETGFAVLDATTTRVLAHGTVPTDRRHSDPQRLATLATALVDLLARHTPADLATELPFVGHNHQTALTLGAVRGVVLYIAHRHGLQIYEYTTSQIKTAMTSNPTASKTQVQRMVQRFTGISITNHNESDAVAIGLTHLRARRLGAILSPR